MTEDSFIHLVPSVFYLDLFIVFGFGVLVGALIMQATAIATAKKVAWEMIDDFNRSKDGGSK